MLDHGDLIVTKVPFPNDPEELKTCSRSHNGHSEGPLDALW